MKEKWQSEINNNINCCAFNLQKWQKSQHKINILIKYASLWSVGRANSQVIACFNKQKG